VGAAPTVGTALVAAAVGVGADAGVACEAYKANAIVAAAATMVTIVQRPALRADSSRRM